MANLSWLGGLLAALGLTTALADVARVPYQPADDALAAIRIARWEQMLNTANNLGADSLKLKAVNDYVNGALRYYEDRYVWGVNDYWASPNESLSIAMGDCEDYAIAKYFSLVRLGFDKSKLRLVYVKVQGQKLPHMVLSYDVAGSEPLILDNLDTAIQASSERKDLVPVYSLNDEGIFTEGARLPGPARSPMRWTDLMRKASRSALVADSGRSARIPHTPN